MLEDLGLDGPGLALYEELLARPGCGWQDKDDDLAAPAPQVLEVLSRLQQRGLVRPRPDGAGWLAERPDIAAEALLAEESRQLAERQARLAHAQSTMTGLLERYVASQVTGGGPSEIERIDGRAALLTRFEQISATATREMLTIAVAADTPAEEIPAIRRADRTLHQRGGRSRNLEPACMRSCDHLMGYALEASAEGDEFRVSERPPMTLVIIDRHVACVPIDQEALSLGAYLVWSPAVVRAHRAVRPRLGRRRTAVLTAPGARTGRTTVAARPAAPGAAGQQRDRRRGRPTDGGEREHGPARHHPADGRTRRRQPRPGRPGRREARLAVALPGITGGPAACGASPDSLAPASFAP